MVKDSFEPSQPGAAQHAIRKFLIEGLSQQYSTLPKVLCNLRKREDGRQQCHQLLAETVRQMHETLLSHGRFQAALDAPAACSPAADHPWRFHLLGESPLIIIRSSFPLMPDFSSSSFRPLLRTTGFEQPFLRGHACLLEFCRVVGANTFYLYELLRHLLFLRLLLIAAKTVREHCGLGKTVYRLPAIRQRRRSRR